MQTFLQLKKNYFIEQFQSTSTYHEAHGWKMNIVQGKSQNITSTQTLQEQLRSKWISTKVKVHRKVMHTFCTPFKYKEKWNC